MADNTGLQFTLTCEGLPPDSFAVTEFSGHEALGAPFEFTIQLASRRDDIAPTELVDGNATLTWWQDGQPTRYVHGVVSAFTQQDTGFHHTLYQLSLTASAKRLELRHNSRIFQQLSVPEIISIILQEMAITDYAFAIKHPCQPREYCVQYRETDLAFITRLAAEEGLVYYFIHQQDKHEIVFADNTQALIPLTQVLPYNAMASGHAPTPFVSAFSLQSEIASAKVQLKDYSFKQPAYSFLQNQQGQGIEFQRDDYEHYDYPGRYKDDATGEKFTRVRQQYLNRDSVTATAQSNQPRLFAGAKFDLTEHLNPSFNAPWQVITIKHVGEQPQALEEHGGSGQTRYYNTLKLLPEQRQWQLDMQAKPKVDGPQIATVTGPQGEEIFCDEHGRVKVQFPWDRYSNNDENASCWLRVAQGWAGSQYGAMAIPRIGHEVIVSFLEGDPDQPIITGRTYHATNKPPYALPEHKTRTVIRTETHKGDGYNELRFEDEMGQEEIYLHAQKDFNSLVENDQAEQIKRDRHSEVDRDSFKLIKGNQHHTVDGESRLHTKCEQSLVINGSLHIKAGQAWLSDTGNELHIKAGSKVVLEAGAEITVKAGSSYIKVDPAGVHLSGANVNLNSGGAASKGSGYAGTLARLPGDVEQATVLTTHFTDITALLKSANANVVPLIIECNKAAQ
ncbi:type VI secretion system Vgr family protein [Motilimonas eburnea]|uniref:type VI secretion system Vgr family protein n=1 Tax=Motilimonas eburnea TaxID=1737488 RepID=UPI001E42481F|nr:type VI secretion system tip protein VgrG [Motilimonas eburnea]MCE2572823.1 type VI secretion system tip protein VgrG [Motilimonas eburnea]